LRSQAYMNNSGHNPPMGKNLVDFAGHLGVLRYRNAEDCHRRDIASVGDDEEYGHW